MPNRVFYYRDLPVKRKQNVGVQKNIFSAHGNKSIFLPSIEANEFESTMLKQKPMKWNPNSIVDENGKVRWLDLMKRFTDSKKPKCKILEKPAAPIVNAQKKFATGSSYEGTMDSSGMCGRGSYQFPFRYPNVLYEGNFENGEFHGEGEYTYEDGTVLIGDFEKGTMIKKTLRFADGLIYTEEGWLYCRPPDRRFTIEYDEGLMPGGESFMTADPPPIEIEPEKYDVGYGIYDPLMNSVSHYEDPNLMIRATDEKEKTWIEHNCRDGRDEPLGPMPFLYEKYNDPEPKLPENPPPAAKSIYQDEFDDWDEDERIRRSTLGAKFKPRFFYGHTSKASEGSGRYSKASVIQQSSSLKVISSQTDEGHIHHETDQ